MTSVLQLFSNQLSHNLSSVILLIKIYRLIPTTISIAFNKLIHTDLTWNEWKDIEQFSTTKNLNKRVWWNWWKTINTGQIIYIDIRQCWMSYWILIVVYLNTFLLWFMSGWWKLMILFIDCTWFALSQAWACMYSTTLVYFFNIKSYVTLKWLRWTKTWPFKIFDVRSKRNKNFDISVSCLFGQCDWNLFVLFIE